MIVRKLSLGGWVLVIAVAGIIISSVVVSYLSLAKFEAVLVPALASKTVVVGQSTRDLITKLLDYGVPLDRMRGMEEEFAGILADHREIRYITLLDARGEVLYAQSSEEGSAPVLPSTENGVENKETVLPIVFEDQRRGTLHVGQNNVLMAKLLKDILYDIVTVVIVAILMAVELLIFLTVFTIGAPIKSLQTLFMGTGRGDFSQSLVLGSGDEISRFAHRVNGTLTHLGNSYQSLRGKCQTLCGPMLDRGRHCVDDCICHLQQNTLFKSGKGNEVSEKRLIFVRPPLFLLIFSESMSLSFFPNYVEKLYTPIAGIPKDFIVGLPISVFMLIWAFSLPPAGQWSDRVGRRKSFMFGAMITGLGLVLTGFAAGMVELLIYRCLTAVGYALVFITAQGFVTDNTTADNRTRGMSIFLSGFFSGALCGAAIGGILASRIGYSQTFMLSALLSVASAVFVYQFVKHEPDDNRQPVRKLRLGDIKLLFSNPRFLTITFLTAIPAKICLTGFLYYTGPLYLKFLGSDVSSVGRVMMAYGLAIILISPLTAYLADRLGQRQHFVILGGLFSGLSLLVVYLFPSVLGVLLAVALLGVGHAIGISPQLSLISSLPQKSEQEVALGATIGIFRLTERLGNVGGPIIAATWITLFGFSGAFLVFGAYMLCSTLLFAALMAYFNRQEAGMKLDSCQGEM